MIRTTKEEGIMNKIDIVFSPNKILRDISDEVSEDEVGEELEEHMKNMLTKMYELNGVGLAGVQVGDPRRILVADAGSRPMMMVNPKIVEASEETVSFQEGCISLPGFVLDVERSESITVEYTTPLGEKVSESLFGVEAVVVQHEIDHLNGITLLDKVSKLKRDIYNRKIKKFKRRVLNRIKQRNQVYY